MTAEYHRNLTVPAKSSVVAVIWFRSFFLNQWTYQRKRHWLEVRHGNGTRNQKFRMIPMWFQVGLFSSALLYNILLVAISYIPNKHLLTEL
jgi:hypothetical protein